MHPPRRLPVLLLAALALAAVGPTAAEPELTPAPFAYVTGHARAGEIVDRRLPETSGLAASRRQPGRLWALNDGGNPPALFLLEGDGRVVARYHLEGVDNHDWEDLAAFVWLGTPYLLVADIGDNLARRDDGVLLHLIVEPEAGQRGALRPAASVRFRYPDGPRDAEGVAVDVGEASVLVVTKREAAPRFYRLPLRLDTPREALMAERLGVLVNPEPRFDPPGGRATRSLFGAAPTALDLDDAGRNLLLLTYTAVYRLVRGQGEPWTAALERPFERLADHPLPQAEALAVAPDGTAAWFTSERLPAPLWRVDLAPGR